MSRENPASHEENPEHHGKPEPREDAAPEEGAPKQPESQDNPAPREKSPVPGGNVESTGETAAEPAAESSAEGENEGSDSEERSEGQGERSEEHAQGKRSATFWIATACAVFVLVTAHLWAAGAFQESGPAPLPPRIPIPTLSASPPSSDSEEEEENSAPESTARTIRSTGATARTLAGRRGRIKRERPTWAARLRCRCWTSIRTPSGASKPRTDRDTQRTLPNPRSLWASNFA